MNKHARIRYPQPVAARLYAVLAAVLLALTACSASVGSGPINGSTPYTDYFLLGEDIYNIRGPDAGNPEVYEAIIETMSGRGLFMGLYSRGGRFDNEWTIIDSGGVSSRLMRYDGFDFESLPYLRGGGFLDAFGSFVDVDQDINSNFSLLPGFEDLRLEGQYSLFEAQRLIDEVSFIPFRDEASAFTTPATWRFSGFYYGDFFEVTFEQDLRAIAEYYTIYDY